MNDEPAELRLLDETRACRECKWFWGPVPPYGPFPTFDFEPAFPEPVKNGHRLPIVSGGAPWLTARGTGPGQIEPAVLHGCRKAPIMTLGINPNMGGFFATPDAAGFAYPQFSRAESYAYYYRHRSVFQETLGRDGIQGRLAENDRLLAPAPGKTLSVARSDSHRWVQIQVELDDGSRRSLEFAWDAQQVPILLAERGKPFEAGAVLAGVLGRSNGSMDLRATSVGYYLRFQAVLRELERLAGWPETLQIGEDVSQGDLVACASPGWSKANYDIPQARISENCAGNKRFSLRQLLQSQPQVLVFVGRSALAMFAEHAPAAPWLRQWAERDIFHLLRETTTRPTYLEVDGDGVRLRARVLCTPHFSYADNYTPGVRLSQAAWRAFQADHAADANVLLTEKRITPSDPSEDLVFIRIDPSGPELALSQQGRTALLAYHYSPVHMLGSALWQEVQSGNLALENQRLRRAPGGCKFCVNDRWSFPEGCPYPNGEQTPVSNAETIRLANALGTPAPSGSPPDAVRVWRGFRRPDLTQSKFQDELKSVFVPATVHLMRPFGLVAYLPTLLPSNIDPPLPAELALVFYRSQQAYKDAGQTPSGQAYRALHGVAFASDSRSSFPILWDGVGLEEAKPYRLLDVSANWQEGNTELWIGRLATGAIEELKRSLQELRRAPPPGLDGYIFLLEGGYYFRWAHFIRHARLPELGERGVTSVLTSRSVDHAISPDTSERVDPVPLTDGKTLNLVFPPHPA